MSFDSFAMLDEYESEVEIVEVVDRAASVATQRQPRRKNEDTLKVRRKLEDYFEERRLARELSLSEYDLEN